MRPPSGPVTHQPDDPGPVADIEVEHGETGTPIPPWVVIVAIVAAVALVAALFRL